MRGGTIQSSPTQPTPSDQGIALVLVMLALLVLTFLAATIVFTARSEALASANYKLDTQADYLAKAGIQAATNWFRSARFMNAPPTTTPPSGCAATNNAGCYYLVTSNGNSLPLYTANTSPVKCTVASGCPNPNNPVQLIGIPGTGNSNYPAVVDAVGNQIATNFANDLNGGGSGMLINADPTDSNDTNAGHVWINAQLINYETVGVGYPPNITSAPVATWLITSRATWNPGNSGVVATAEEKAIIQPIFLPWFSNAMYAFCNATMGGSSGTCTDAFNSSLGSYGMGNSSVSGQCNSSTANNVIAANAGVGANGGVTLTGSPTISGNITIGQSPTAGCTVPDPPFSGGNATILGEVVNGPHIPPPPMPSYPPFAGNTAVFPDGPPGPAPSISGGITTWPQTGAGVSPSGTQPVPTIPTGYSQPCEPSPAVCNGSQTNPFMVGSISLSGSNQTLNLYGGPDAQHPVYYDINTISESGQGAINVTGYVVLNVKSSISIVGQGVSQSYLNGSPSQVLINYTGTNPVSLGGNGAISAVLVAPNANVTLGGGGSQGYMVGAVLGNNVTMQGGYPLHYDVQLGQAGGVLGVIVNSGYSRRKM